MITLFNHDFSGRDLILLIGGLFLLFKATRELHTAGWKGSSRRGGSAKFMRPSGPWWHRSWCWMLSSRWMR